MFLSGRRCIGAAAQMMSGPFDGLGMFHHRSVTTESPVFSSTPIISDYGQRFFGVSRASASVRRNQLGDQLVQTPVSAYWSC
jgi:hypothetical protein